MWKEITCYRDHISVSSRRNIAQYIGLFIHNLDYLLLKLLWNNFLFVRSDSSIFVWFAIKDCTSVLLTGLWVWRIWAPCFQVVAPIFSLVVPKLAFKGANKRGIPVSRDAAAMLAKYSDPLVYTGPIRVRTGHEILRISSYLTQNLRSVNVPFLVLHGTGDRVTDPLASQDLYNEAASKYKDIKLYSGFLHDLLFEPERDEIGADIINWMERRLQKQSST